MRGSRHVVDACITCGVVFTIPERVFDQQQESGGFHYCPNGHQQGWSKDGCENAKLRRERDRLVQRVAQKDDEIKSLEGSVAAHKGQITKLKKRVSAGVCPCCTRHFTNLERHMHSKHPQYTEGPELQVIEGGRRA